MAQQEYDDSGDWFEQNAPPEQYYGEPQQDQPQDQQAQNEPSSYQEPQQVFRSYAQAPTQGNDGFPAGNTDPPDNGGSNPNVPGPSGPSGPSAPSGGGGSDRATREAQAAELNRRLGLSDPGNLESFLSGRNTWAGYLADQNARATNYTGDRMFDSQGPMYDQRTNQLSSAGVAALRAAGLNPNGTRINAPGATGGGGGGTSSGGGGSQNYSSMLADFGDGGTSFGAAPAAFGESYSTLARPDNLRQPYAAPTWNENFTAPTAESVQSEPGYALGLNEGILAKDRTAAARGSVLSGGTQKAAARYATDYASTKYGESTGRLFDQYQQRYGQFQDTAARGLAERNTNENAYQTDASNNLSQYVSRFNAYQTAIGNQRNADNDIWSRNQSLIDNSLRAAALARPF